MTPSMLQTLKRQALRGLARTDPYAFQEYVFGFEAAEHIRKMGDFVLERINNRENGIVLAPRGSTKTTSLNTGLLSFVVATQPDIRIGLFSQKDKKAEAMSGAIRWTISESEAFREVFGNLRGSSKWTDSEWRRKGSRWASSKDMTMVTGGVNNSSAVSKRFDVIFCDDILDSENTYNIDRREKTEDWFWKTMKPAQAAEGASIIVVGTRWTEGDLYERLIETNKWPSLVIPAITQDENGNDKSYWPSVWPLERLYKEREDIGWDNFNCAYQNDLSGNAEGFIFRREWFEHEYFDELPRDRTFIQTMGVDLASSERERADYTARAIVAEDDRHEHWILGVYRTKIESGHKQFVKDGAAAFPGISKIIIETNQHQSTLVLDLLNETTLPVVGRKTDTDKRTRARAVAARYESHRVHHHRSLKGGEFEAELTNFPKGHDDMIDAVGLAMDIRGVSGSVGAVKSAFFAPAPGAAPIAPVGSQLRFRDGPQIVPAHIAKMLTGIETERYTREEAIGVANARAESNYIRKQMASAFGVRR
jgi:predicted phage terminase large subunit-like protein